MEEEALSSQSIGLCRDWESCDTICMQCALTLTILASTEVFQLMPLTFGFPLFSEAIQAVYLNLKQEKPPSWRPSLEPSPWEGV